MNVSYSTKWDQWIKAEWVGDAVSLTPAPHLEGYFSGRCDSACISLCNYRPGVGILTPAPHTIPYFLTIPAPHWPFHIVAGRSTIMERYI
jgi:hypothetical protein